jgi:ABC-type multidrug transport system ATPase subunit/pSer/pThr/pTyr-binding forkhead associated (FHA) protein
MRIALAEIRGEKKLGTREFEQTEVKIGREKDRCDLVFDRAQWPMVSRTHATLAIEGGRCYLTDLGSTHGTLINGQRIVGKTEIQPGMIFQLGPQGPILSLEQVGREAPVPNFSETLIDSTAAKQQAALRLKAHERSQGLPPVVLPKTLVDKPNLQAPLAASQPPTLGRSSQLPKPKTQPILIVESGSPTQMGLQFPLRGDNTLLGRDVSADIKLDAVAAVVSRRHAEIRRRPDGVFLIVDLKSFNGTLLNQRRITQPEVLHQGDRVQLGAGGPVLCFNDPSQPPPAADFNVSMEMSGPVIAVSSDMAQIQARTIVYQPGTERIAQSGGVASGEQLLFQRTFNGKQMLSVGRGAENDIRLDGLTISKHHAQFLDTQQGVMVEEASATNGVYLNGGRVSGRRPVGIEDIVQIGPFVLRVNAQKGIAVFDTRAKTRIDAIEITQTVPGGARKLLDQISLAINANEFVGVLGPSGSGKSTLLNVLNGMRRSRQGRVLVNQLELYQHIDSLKQSIGFVPQDDIIHRQLTVYRTLYYVARLRLSRDVPKNEIDQIIGEVLDVTGLTARRDVLISQLSGGQRKRVSIAVELITKPSVIFLDEPTSGLDPGTEERIMKLFRQIAESGRTVVLTTHAMENVRLFDKVALLMGGKLIFYGTPAEALKFVGANNFIELYSKIEEPVDSEAAKLRPASATETKAELRAYEARRAELAEAAAEDWRRRFKNTEQYRRHVAEPLSQVQLGAQGIQPPSRRRSIIDAMLQWVTLVRRYSEVLTNDKWNLLILFGQAPTIALLTYLVVGKSDPRDFPYFVLSLIAIWFGTSVAARELVKERPIFKRERMVNLRLFPYLGSKLFVLSFVVGLQATLLFTALKVLHFAGIMYLPGILFGLPHLFVLVLTGVVGIAIGLLISAVVKTSEMATSLVPLILIPQILFAGLTAVPTGVARLVGATMPATWSFDEMKRLSSLDTLKEEGSKPQGENEGKGLFEHTRRLNTRNIEEARNQVKEYSKRTAEQLEEHERTLKEYLRSRTGASTSSSTSPSPVAIGSPPVIPEPREVSDDLSSYVSFLHPWGSALLNVAILCSMLFGLIVTTMVVLRVRDR